MHATLTDYICDLVQNSIEAKASEITLQLTTHTPQIKLTLKDNGCGMTPEQLAKVRDPYMTDPKKHSHRKVGMGLAFLEQLCQATQGSLTIDSTLGEGTELSLALPADHFDIPPLGRLPNCWLSLMAFEGDYNITIQRTLGEESYTVDKNSLSSAVGGFDDAQGLILARQYLNSLEMDINEEGNHAKINT